MTPTLTDAQIADLREQAGDTSESLTPERIQAFYEKALVFGGDDDQTEARTIVYMLRRLIGQASVLVDKGGQIEIEKQSQWFDHIKDVLLPYYEGLAGMSGGGILTAGDLDFGIDADEDDDD